MADSPAAAARAEQQRARRPERDDGDHGVLRAAASGGVTVPGDAVPAVPVQAKPGGAERLAELWAVILAEPFPGVLEDGIGKRLPLGIEAEQPGHLDDPVVHVPLLGPPRHRPGQSLKQRVRASDPAWPQVDPGPAREGGPPHRRAQRPRARLTAQVKQRPLQDGVHEPSLPFIKHIFEIVGVVTAEICWRAGYPRTNMARVSEQPQRWSRATVYPDMWLDPDEDPGDTATSWRSTSSSASFDAAERANSAIQLARRTKIR